LDVVILLGSLSKLKIGIYITAMLVPMISSTLRDQAIRQAISLVCHITTRIRKNKCATYSYSSFCD
jgi:hypothetical protein